MIATSKIYNFLISIFMLCFLLAVGGFLLAYRGHGYMGWLLGVIGIVAGNFAIVTFLVVRVFGKHFKFIKVDKK